MKKQLFTKSFYLDIFRIPEYYYLCFERNVDLEVNFALKMYKKKFGLLPKRILAFECNTGEHARVIWKNKQNDIDITCFNSDDRFNQFTIKKFGLENKSSFFTNNLNSSLIKKKHDVILWLFDTIAYFQNREDIIHLLNFFYKNLNNNGCLIIQSNSGIDLSYLDYSNIYDNKNIDSLYLGKVEWAIDNPSKTEWKKFNNVGKRITIIDKTTNNLVEKFEYYSMEKVYAQSDIMSLFKRSLFSTKGNIEFYENFNFKKIQPNSYETISVFIKK